MGHVMYCYIGCIVDRAFRIEETLSDFFVKLWILDKWDMMVWRRVTRHPLVSAG